MPDKLAAAAYLVDLINFEPEFASFQIAAAPLEKMDQIFDDRLLLKTASLEIFSELLEMIREQSGHEKTAEEVIEEKKHTLPQEYLRLLNEYEHGGSYKYASEQSATMREIMGEYDEASGLDIKNAKKELINEILEKKAELERLDGKKTLEVMRELESKSLTELSKIAYEINEKYTMRYTSIGEPMPSGEASGELDSFTQFLLSKAGQI